MLLQFSRVVLVQSRDLDYLLLSASQEFKDKDQSFPLLRLEWSDSRGE